MPQRVVLEIRYPGKQTETNERLSVMFESWPEFNEETEWPKIEQHLQKLRLREKLDNCTVHYYKSSSDHLELKDSSSLAALAQRVQLQKLLPLRFIPLIHVRDGMVVRLLTIVSNVWAEEDSELFLRFETEFPTSAMD